jgi:branched-chain amino acid transport system permease protein
MILYTVLIKFYNFSGGTDGLSIRLFSLAGVTPANGGLAKYYLVLVATVGVAYCGARFLASPLGYLMQAVRFNEIRIEYLGVSASHAIFASYLLSGAVGGLGGALVAYLVGHVSPELAFWVSSGDFVFVAVLGGTGSVFAPFVGSVAFEFVKNYALKCMKSGSSRSESFCYSSYAIARRACGVCLSCCGGAESDLRHYRDHFAYAPVRPPARGR